MNEFLRREDTEHGIKEILESLIGRRVIIILDSGKRLFVQIEAVRDGLLIAACDCKVIFIDIECICAVVTECPEVLRTLIREEKEDRIC